MNKDINSALRDALVLIAITLVSGLLLGLVNMLTEEPIRAQKEAAVTESCKAVFPSEEGFAQVASFELTGYVPTEMLSADLSKEGVTIGNVYNAIAADGSVVGYAIEVTSAEGYGGDIKLMCGITTEGILRGVSILEISETDHGHDRRTDRACVARIMGNGERQPRYIRNDLHPALVQRAAADDAEVVAVKAVVLLHVLEDPAQVVGDAFVDRAHHVLSRVHGGQVEHGRTRCGRADGAPFAFDPGGEDEVVAARRHIVDDAVHVVVDAVAVDLGFMFEERVLDPLDVGAGGFHLAQHRH